jgi:hypothetical protein
LDWSDAFHSNLEGEGGRRGRGEDRTAEQSWAEDREERRGQKGGERRVDAMDLQYNTLCTKTAEIRSVLNIDFQQADFLSFWILFWISSSKVLKSQIGLHVNKKIYFVINEGGFFSSISVALSIFLSVSLSHTALFSSSIQRQQPSLVINITDDLWGVSCYSIIWPMIPLHIVSSHLLYVVQ